MTTSSSKRSNRLSILLESHKAHKALERKLAGLREVVNNTLIKLLTRYPGGEVAPELHWAFYAPASTSPTFALALSSSRDRAVLSFFQRLRREGNQTALRVIGVEDGRVLFSQYPPKQNGEGHDFTIGSFHALDLEILSMSTHELSTLVRELYFRDIELDDEFAIKVQRSKVQEAEREASLKNRVLEVRQELLDFLEQRAASRKKTKYAQIKK